MVCKQVRAGIRVVHTYSLVSFYTNYNWCLFWNGRGNTLSWCKYYYITTCKETQDKIIKALYWFYRLQKYEGLFLSFSNKKYSTLWTSILRGGIFYNSITILGIVVY